MIKLLIAGIGYVLSKFALRLFAALGLTLVTYKALDVAITAAINRIQSSLSGAPSAALDILALSGFPEAFSIICSAYLTAAAIRASKVWFGVVKS